MIKQFQKLHVSEDYYLPTGHLQLSLTLRPRQTTTRTAQDVGNRHHKQRRCWKHWSEATPGLFQLLRAGTWRSVADFDRKISRAGRVVAAPQRRPQTPFGDVIADLRRQRSTETRRPERRLLQRAIWTTRKQREWTADEELASLTHRGASSSEERKTTPTPRSANGDTAGLTKARAEHWHTIVGHGRSIDDETVVSRERLQQRISALAELDLPDFF